MCLWGTKNNNNNPQLYRCWKLLQKCDIRDFQSLPPSVPHDMEVTERSSENPLHPQGATIISWRTRWTHQVNILVSWLWHRRFKSPSCPQGNPTIYNCIFLYIQYPSFYIHTSALTIANHFMTNRNVKLNWTHRHLSFTRMTHRWGGKEKHQVWQVKIQLCCSCSARPHGGRSERCAIC